MGLGTGNRTTQWRSGGRAGGGEAGEEWGIQPGPTCEGKTRLKPGAVVAGFIWRAGLPSARWRGAGKERASSHQAMRVPGIRGRSPLGRPGKRNAVERRRGSRSHKTREGESRAGQGPGKE